MYHQIEIVETIMVIYEASKVRFLFDFLSPKNILILQITCKMAMHVYLIPNDDHCRRNSSMKLWGPEMMLFKWKEYLV